MANNRDKGYAQLAQAIGNEDLVKVINGEPHDLPNLTGQELARALGLKADKPEDINMTEFANACLHVQSNPLVAPLPEKQRLQIIRTLLTCYHKFGKASQHKTLPIIFCLKSKVWFGGFNFGKNRLEC